MKIDGLGAVASIVVFLLIVVAAYRMGKYGKILGG